MSAEEIDRELVATADKVMECRGFVLQAFELAKEALLRLRATHTGSVSETYGRADSWLVAVHDSLLIAEDDLLGVMEQVEALRGEL